MLGNTLLIGGGQVDLAFAKEYIRKQDFDTVVCADSGLDTADRLALEVDYAMGDFDSVSTKIYQKYHQMQTAFVSYPPEKDATDMQIVLDWAVEQGAKEIHILGATGKRLDHFLGNVNILMIPLQKGIRTYIVDPYNRLYLVKKKASFEQDHVFGKYISLLPLTEKVTNVYIRGLKYELHGADLAIGNSLGVSNELAKDCAKAELTFDDGILIVIESKD